MKPQTRRSGLLIRELPDELLVYDLVQHRAHCLNRTAALVFRHADGTRSAAELARLPGADDDVVTLALEQLAAAGLIEASASDAARERPAGMSRRELARRVGLAAAILLPAVVSIVAPTPAEALATCVADCGGKLPGTPCTSIGANPCTESCMTGCGATCSTGACTDGGGA
jgi:hypothetical protein